MAFISIRFLFFILSALQLHLSIYNPTYGFLVAAESINTLTLASSSNDLADFGQTIPILGQMARTDQDFKDGLALDLFSPRNRTLIVEKNPSPLPGKFVSGSTGEPFVALSNYSWVIKVNDTARDLIAKVELPYEPENVQNRGFDVANTYVGVLAKDGQSWVVDETRRNVHVSENKTRIIKLTSLDGEYILLGRKTVDTANIFVQYGFGATRTVNLTGGKGIQGAEFVDGLRISLESEKDMRLNIDLKNGVDEKTVPSGMWSLNSFAWAMNTSSSSQQLKCGSVRFPINFSASIRDTKIMVAKRDLGASSSTSFDPLPQRSHEVNCRPDCSVTVKDLQQLDGEYIVLAAGNEIAEEEKGALKEQVNNPQASSAGISLRGIENWAGMGVVLCTSVLVWLQLMY
ncbi:hypothetical protein HBH68_155990 [Parastagonospora nodorum]|nr:hypothetical protein HBH47_139310 [Parastagonospora nodorum]KAH5189460.1 hypothetical protein HBH68_155990 [Parastagonospora nodorum]KAH5452621.1 hypothetical protein HBI30_112450 [Parastagonospora nodorum]KAH5598969.1 hypothetical protein HBI45_156460 [Parastagonospora nodorum]KAH6239139.1 hypothetical protein HBI15_039150 [Parastagonospora nodorum]